MRTSKPRPKTVRGPLLQAHFRRLKRFERSAGGVEIGSLLFLRYREAPRRRVTNRNGSAKFPVMEVVSTCPRETESLKLAGPFTGVPGMRSIKGVLARTLLRSLDAEVVEDPGSEMVDGDGHRDYVGGLWETVGTLQFRFMVARGLEPQHVLLDVACGSLRGGVRFIPYLDPGNYLGIDMHRKLIDAGVQKELGEKLNALKQPQFVVSDRFEFERFSRRPDFAIAQSLFSHLTAKDIGLCLKNLRAVARPGTRFYASFFEVERPRMNAQRSDPRGKFLYSAEQMSQFGVAHGWKPRYIGDWNHPRQQRMMEYLAEG
jgi:ubiquinone/menaquinone biosynthesis C-methylase UbiE